MEENRLAFEKYVTSVAGIKNSKALLDTEYDELLNALKEIKKPSANMKKKIVRNNYYLLDFPTLGLKDVLCLPVKKVS